MSKAYIFGALHDATERKYTYRLSQKEREYVEFVANLLRSAGNKAWVYREGKSRNLYVVEFAKSALSGTEIKTEKEKVDYLRGYFDAEGGVPKRPGVRFYIYFAQKDRKDLEKAKKLLGEIGIKCGKIHNPTKKDPNYWRFFISSQSYKDFVEKVGSWHPRKRQLLRVKI
jgi:intein-encoded DNA endonuclease-like protein